MKNYLTKEIESYLGIFYVGSFCIFCFMLVFSATSAAEQEMEVNTIMIPTLKRISSKQRIAIDAWVRDNDIIVPEDVSRYRYLQAQYPTRPWSSASLN